MHEKLLLIPLIIGEDDGTVFTTGLGTFCHTGALGESEQALGVGYNGLFGSGGDNKRAFVNFNISSLPDNAQIKRGSIYISLESTTTDPTTELISDIEIVKLSNTDGRCNPSDEQNAADILGEINIAQVYSKELVESGEQSFMLNSNAIADLQSLLLTDDKFTLGLRPFFDPETPLGTDIETYYYFQSVETTPPPYLAIYYTLS